VDEKHDFGSFLFVAEQSRLNMGAFIGFGINKSKGRGRQKVVLIYATPQLNSGKERTSDRKSGESVAGVSCVWRVGGRDARASGYLHA